MAEEYDPDEEIEVEDSESIKDDVELKDPKTFDGSEEIKKTEEKKDKSEDFQIPDEVRKSANQSYRTGLNLSTKADSDYIKLVKEFEKNIKEIDEIKESNNVQRLDILKSGLDKFKNGVDIFVGKQKAANSNISAGYTILNSFLFRFNSIIKGFDSTIAKFEKEKTADEKEIEKLTDELQIANKMATGREQTKKDIKLENDSLMSQLNNDLKSFTSKIKLNLENHKENVHVIMGRHGILGPGQVADIKTGHAEVLTVKTPGEDEKVQNWVVKLSKKGDKWKSSAQGHKLVMKRKKDETELPYLEKAIEILEKQGEDV